MMTMMSRTGVWSRVSDMLVPRVQPTVVSHQDCLYVMGGRNSNKVELMSVERYDPATDTWTLVKEMKRKRWGGGGAVFHKHVVVVGGKGKRVGRIGEVYNDETGTWSEMVGDTPVAERAYNLAVVRKPWNWNFPDSRK